MSTDSNPLAGEPRDVIPLESEPKSPDVAAANGSECDDDAPDGPVDGDPHPVLEYASARQSQSTKLVTIATFDQAWEAHLAMGKLENEGIPCVLADENVMAVGIGIYGNLMGGIKLQVPEPEVENARRLLPRRLRTTMVRCPKCKSTDTHDAPLSPGVKILFLCLLGLPYLFVEKRRVCLGCGWVWKAVAEEADEDDDEEGKGGVEDEDGESIEG